jgi:5-methylthioadenosine/S-adenosylhomocysteine deaminase
MSSSSRILRAAWVAPISAPPIARGEVVVEGDRIVAVRPETAASAGPVEDFGDAILLPGLINVHTHLDYTLMRGLLEDLDFFPWIRELTARAETLTEEDWLASATWGAAEAVAGGVTAIGDCTFSGAAFEAARELGLGGVIYQEVFGIDEVREVGAILAELRQRVERMQDGRAGARLRIGISPHAPYTVLPICIHAAESQAEAELIRSGTGPFAEMYRRRGIEWTVPAGSSVAYLDNLGILGRDTLLVHGIQVSASDRALIRARGVAWAHCPKSNAKLGAGVAPLGILRDQGPAPSDPARARVGIGSDSVASNNTMDLFEEMRFAVLLQRAKRHRITALVAQEALEMATSGGASVLGMEAEAGTLEPGKRADLCLVRLGELHTTPAYDPVSALVYTARASDVICTVIAGETRYDARLGSRLEQRFPGTDLGPVRERLGSAAQKMRDWRPLT